MAFWIKDARARIDTGKQGKENIKRNENYTQANISTSNKNADGTYSWSNWGFVKFVGKAHIAMKSISEGDKVVIKSGLIKKEPYNDKEGTRVWPKSEQIVVFDIEVFGSKSDSSESTELPPEDDIPF